MNRGLLSADALEGNMRENAKALVLAAFVADALALGGHWVYNTSVIEKKYGRLTRYENPLGKSYHPTKKRGEFTHYGDQMYLLLETVANLPGFELSHFSKTWRHFFQTYDGYIDKATETTLENFKADKGPGESGSSSTDLAGAARIAPLAYFYRNDKEKFFASARAQTVMTHNHPDVISCATFFSEVVWEVLAGIPPSEAIQGLVQRRYNRSRLKEWTDAGAESRDLPTRQAISDFGQMCAAEAAFPSVIHLIFKYESNLKDALVENVMAGGDSAARGMMTGMVLGAHLGMDAIPDHWLSELIAIKNIRRLLDQM